ncbi:MAG: DNA polymerase III subunit gamma/tau [candidate division Zixibacteria bacterium]|nr:DNA polymerase III subunit gamma/tau [candidate division Zixibacteria bacterium]
MTYQVLARKYRPQTLDEVVGQEHVTTTLRNAISSGRIGSGYIFCGPRGSGKTSVARILAKMINCDKGPTAQLCGECVSCREITTGSSRDVLEIDAASNTGVDDIRNLREVIQYMPTPGKKRIFIIDEVHRLSGPAFDALLKTLEEPPEHAMFIFATTEAQKVPDTILSRTQRFDFRRVSIDTLIELLQRIAKSEGYTLREDAARLIARRGDGSVRDSISLLDQTLSFSEGEVTVELIVSSLGMVDREFLFGYVEKLAAGQTADALRMIAKMVDGGTDIREFMTEMIDHFRTLMTLKATAGSSDILSLTKDELERYRSQLDFFSLGDLLRIADILRGAIVDMKTIDQRWLIEITTVKLAEMESTVRLEEVLSHLQSETENLTPDIPGGSGTGTATERDLFNSSKKKTLTPDPVKLILTRSETAPTQEASQSQAPPEANIQSASISNINLPRINAGWKEFVESVRRSSQMVASQLAMARVIDIKHNQLIAEFAQSGAASKAVLDHNNYRKLVEDALREFYKAPLSIRYTVNKDKESHFDAPKQSAPKITTTLSPEVVEEFVKKNPRLKEIMDKVGGEIISVTKTN